ncbi:hypothetical protein MTP99_018758 [Tenebrio molitor]|nr:hypothetical protein MTP99_018758 [Tenebrio molitor]
MCCVTVLEPKPPTFDELTCLHPDDSHGGVLSLPRCVGPEPRPWCVVLSADRQSGFPEWSDRRRSPRTRSACLAPPARISPARLSPPVISGVCRPTDDPDFRSGGTAAGHSGPDQPA